MKVVGNISEISEMLSPSRLPPCSFASVLLQGASFSRLLSVNIKTRIADIGHVTNTCSLASHWELKEMCTRSLTQLEFS